MKVSKRETETYILTGLKTTDPVKVYVTNYAPGKGEIVITCFGDAWTHSWSAMGDSTMQEFFIHADVDYLIGKFIGRYKGTQIDFDEINDEFERRGIENVVTNDFELALASEDVEACYGEDCWREGLPTRASDEYVYLEKIVNHIKQAFKEEEAEKIEIKQIVDRINACGPLDEWHAAISKGLTHLLNKR